MVDKLRILIKTVGWSILKIIIYYCVKPATLSGPFMDI